MSNIQRQVVVLSEQGTILILLVLSSQLFLLYFIYIIKAASIGV